MWQRAIEKHSKNHDLAETCDLNIQFLTVWSLNLIINIIIVMFLQAKAGLKHQTELF